MGIKMVIGFMVSRSLRFATFAVTVAAAAALSVACQKVPLLAPSGSSITLIAAATTLPINGSTDVIAQIIEASGTPPHSGTRVTFTTSLGLIQPSEADTDVSGRAVVKFIAGTGSGVASITALSGGTAVTAANAVKIQIGAAAVGGISASASPATLPSSGGTATITATVLDSSGNVLPGVPVTFAIDTSATTSSGAGALSASVVSTDANGRATTQLTTNRTTVVNASAGVAVAGGGTGTTTTPATTVQTAKVTVNVNATSTIAIGTQAPAAPAVGQTVTLPLTYTAPTGVTASPITRLTVDWGDGTIQPFTGQVPAVSHAYARDGSFVVLITGTDAFGDPSTATTVITVTPRPRPTVGVTAAPNPATAGQLVTFTLTVTQGTTGATTQSVVWDFGDGSAPQRDPGNSLNEIHRFASPNIYHVTATVTDSTGQTGQATVAVAVN
jgi:hypothetical protein